MKIASVVNFPDGGSDPAGVERETRRALGAGWADAAHFRIGASALFGELAGIASTLP